MTTSKSGGSAGKKKPVAKKAAVPARKKSSASKPAVRKATPARKAKPAVKRAASKPPAKAGLSYGELVAHLAGLKAVSGRVGDLWLLNVPWGMGPFVVAQGGKYDKESKSYYIVAPTVPALLKLFVAPEYSWLRWLQDEVNGNTAVASRPTPVGGWFVPRAHQVEAGRVIANRHGEGYSGFLLADTTGVGKTISALEGVLRVHKDSGRKSGNLLILCPNPAVSHWASTLERVDTGGLRVMVINFEQHQRLLVATAKANEAVRKSTRNRRLSAGGEGLIGWDYIIVDEAHKLKNMTSQRSMGVDRLIETNPFRKPFTLYLTATPAQNPLELGYLGRVVSEWQSRVSGKSVVPLNMAKWGDWLVRNGFNVKKNDSGWAWLPIKPETKFMRDGDVRRLNVILSHPQFPMLRRKAEDIAGWPELSIFGLPVELSIKDRLDYDELWNDFRRKYELAINSNNPTSRLAEEMRFSQKASVLKVEETVEQVLEFLEQGHQVAVSVRFIESLYLIREKLVAKGYGVSEISGRLNNSEREAERLLFQKGNNKVVLFTVEEAISLHAGQELNDGSSATMSPRTLLVHDMRYSGISMTQIVGRAHRDGQKANAYLLYARGTVEERIKEIMLNKMEAINSMLGEDFTFDDIINEV